MACGPCAWRSQCGDYSLVDAGFPYRALNHAVNGTLRVTRCWYAHGTFASRSARGQCRVTCTAFEVAPGYRLLGLIQDLRAPWSSERRRMARQAGTVHEEAMP